MSYAIVHLRGCDLQPELSVDYQEGDTVLGYDITNAVFNDEDLNGFKVRASPPPLVPTARL